MANASDTSTPTASGSEKPFHLDPTKNQVDAIVQHFKSREFEAGTAALKALQDTDQGNKDAWKRHIAVINGQINLQSLGVANADQLLGVAQNGSLITSNSDDTRQQLRAGNDLSVEHEKRITFGQAAQIQDTKTYEKRVAVADQMEAQPQPKGANAQEVETIIGDFNCKGTPQVDRSNPAEVVTTFSADQCATGRPVIDVDRLNGQHAVDGPKPTDWLTRVMGWEFGQKDPTFDSTQYLIDTLSAYHRAADARN